MVEATNRVRLCSQELVRRWIAALLLLVPGAVQAQWITHEFRDSFGRGTPVVMVDGDARINNRGRLESGRATLVIRRTDAYVVTGDTFICHSPPSNPVRLSLQVDGGRVLDGVGADVSTDKRAVFLGQTALNMVLTARREIKMETRDHCGTTVAITFGSTNLHEVLSHVGRRAPAQLAPQNQPTGSAQQRQSAAPPPAPSPALAEARAALARGDFATAETSARAVIASRVAAHQTDALMLLGDALLGRRDFPGAAIAYDDARRRNPNGSRAAEAIVGIANAFIGLNNNGDACAVLAEARIPASGPLAERAADARRRARCAR